MPELDLNGVALAPIVVAIVEIAKRVGMPVNYAPWLTAALSVLGYGLIVAVSQGRLSADVVGYALNGVLIFLGSFGVYHGLKRGLGYQ